MTVNLKAWADKIETDMFVDTEECRELVEEIKRLRAENVRLKNINDGLLTVIDDE